MMRVAQVALTNYFVSELHLTANRTYDSQQASEIRVEDLRTDVAPDVSPDDSRNWQITLNITLQAPADRNCPYDVSLEMVGFFTISQEMEEDKIAKFLKINGSSMLFGAAREVVRAATSRGPYKALLLPSVSFWEPIPTPPEESEAPVI